MYLQGCRMYNSERGVAVRPQKREERKLTASTHHTLQKARKLAPQKRKNPTPIKKRYVNEMRERRNDFSSRKIVLCSFPGRREGRRGEGENMNDF